LISFRRRDRLKDSVRRSYAALRPAGKDSRLKRYSLIENKNRREIVLLRGTGCRWKKCSFCDYHKDCSTDENANFTLNSSVLDLVTGRYHRLEVIDSGSFPELDDKTVRRIIDVCIEKRIDTLYFECHYIYRDRIAEIKKLFAGSGITAKAKLGIETFDAGFRENILMKGISESDPSRIAEHFDQACLLFGISGQTEASMRLDIKTGLDYFERLCINIMTPNTTPVRPDPHVIETFTDKIFPHIAEDQRIDILFDNKDFGVG